MLTTPETHQWGMKKTSIYEECSNVLSLLSQVASVLKNEGNCKFLGTFHKLTIEV